MVLSCVKTDRWCSFIHRLRGGLVDHFNLDTERKQQMLTYCVTPAVLHQL